MRKEPEGRPVPEAAVVIPTNITYTDKGAEVDTVAIGTSPEAAATAARLGQEHFSKIPIEEALGQRSPGRSSSSHAMPGSRWSPTAWQPTGPKPRDLSWLKPTNTGDPRHS